MKRVRSDAVGRLALVQLGRVQRLRKLGLRVAMEHAPLRRVGHVCDLKGKFPLASNRRHIDLSLIHI